MKYLLGKKLIVIKSRNQLIIQGYGFGNNSKGNQGSTLNDIRIKWLYELKPFFFFFLVLEIKPRAPCILGKCSSAELHPQPSFINQFSKGSKCPTFIGIPMLKTLSGHKKGENLANSSCITGTIEWSIKTR
jgi:hypothetical protein